MTEHHQLVAAPVIATTVAVRDRFKVFMIMAKAQTSGLSLAGVMHPHNSTGRASYIS